MTRDGRPLTPPPVVMVEYPFPVDDGAAVAILRLPKFLSQADADRLIALIQTLVMDGGEE